MKTDFHGELRWLNFSDVSDDIAIVKSHELAYNWLVSQGYVFIDKRNKQKRFEIIADTPNGKIMILVYKRHRDKVEDFQLKDVAIESLNSTLSLYNQNGETIQTYYISHYEYIPDEVSFHFVASKRFIEEYTRENAVKHFRQSFKTGFKEVFDNPDFYSQKLNKDSEVSVVDDFLVTESTLRKRDSKFLYANAKKNVRTYSTFDRDPLISAWAKEVAHGVCQLCDKEAPFSDMNGQLFLECHHIRWLSKGGTDDLENVIALCPNCHRRMHFLDLHEDVKKLEIRNQELQIKSQ